MYTSRMKIVLALLLLTMPSFAQSARDYFNELYSAAGLDRMADGHVCFDDDPELKTFFIFGKSENLRQFLIDNGGYAKLSKANQKYLDKGFLIVRGYDKGISIGDEDTYDKDGESWIRPFILQKKKMRMVLSITWATLRYKRTVELISPDGSTKPLATRYGRCEVVPPTVRQKG